MSAAAARVVSEPETSFRKRCGVCARSFTADAWAALPVVATLPSSRIQEHLSVSAAWAIELRSCACGAVLASRR